MDDEKVMVYSHDQVQERLNKIRNNSVRRVCVLYWLFGHRVFSKRDVLNFIEKELGVSDKATIHHYYAAFRFLVFISNQRRVHDVKKLKKGQIGKAIN